MAGMFGDRSKVVIRNGQPVQEQQPQQDQPVVEQERQNFADIMEALARQDAATIGALRESLGITQSRTTPFGARPATSAPETSLRPQLRPEAPTESLRPQARPEPVQPSPAPQAMTTAPSALNFGILDQAPIPPAAGGAAPMQSEVPSGPMPSAADATATAQTKSDGMSLDQFMQKQIAVHEGQVNYPYKDSRGFWTIGIGHLIGDGSDAALAKSGYTKYSKDNPMPDEEVSQLFAKDLDKHKKIAESYPFYDKMSEEGKKAIIDLTFNMGDFYNKKKPDGTYEWKNLRAQLDRGDWEAAADNLASSAYARQVGNRAVTVTNQLRQAGSQTQAQQSTAETTVEPDRLGMIGGVKDQDTVWQSFDGSGMAHSADYKDYSQLFREYTTEKKEGYVPVGDMNGQTVYASPDYAKDENGNYISVNKNEAVALAAERGSILPTREMVKELYAKSTRIPMAIQPIGQTGGTGDTGLYTQKIQEAIAAQGVKAGQSIVHGKEFFVAK